jgi:hypothetical protein
MMLGDVISKTPVTSVGHKLLRETASLGRAPRTLELDDFLLSVCDNRAASRQQCRHGPTQPSCTASYGRKTEPLGLPQAYLPLHSRHRHADALVPAHALSDLPPRVETSSQRLERQVRSRVSRPQADTVERRFPFRPHATHDACPRQRASIGGQGRLRAPTRPSPASSPAYRSLTSGEDPGHLN